MSKKQLAVPIGFTLFFLWVTCHLIYVRNGDLVAGHPNVWADYAAHYAYTAHFAFKPLGLWFSHNPIFVGGKLHYPFLINLFSSLLVRVGLEIGTALKITSFLAMSGAAWLLYFFFRKILGRGGLALVLIFLGGNLGWMLYARDLFTGGDFWGALLFPPKEYGHLNDLGLSVGGTLSCLWFPQRGLPLAVIASVPLFFVLSSQSGVSRRKQIGAGLLAGLLPIIHVHTLVCVTVLLACFIVDRRKEIFVFLPVLLSFFLAAAFWWILYHYDSPSASFLTYQPWWLASNPGTAAERMGWLVFWIWNWSIFLPLVITSFFWVKPQGTRFFATAGAALFIAANFIRFQPWDWDNTKIFFWSYLFLTPAVVQVLEKLSSIRYGRLLTRGLVFLLIATGALDALRFASPSRTSLEFFTKQEQAWAQKLKAMTPVDAVILSSNNPHDWVASLAGRQVVMGYTGWLWSYGLPGMEREQEVRAFFANSPDGEKLLTKYGVTHITIDQKTLAAYEVDEKHMANYPVVWAEPGVTVYRVSAKLAEPLR